MVFDTDEGHASLSTEELVADFTKAVALFTLKSREEHEIPVIVQQLITSNLQSLVNIFSIKLTVVLRLT